MKHASKSLDTSKMELIIAVDHKNKYGETVLRDGLYQHPKTRIIYLRYDCPDWTNFRLRTVWYRVETEAEEREARRLIETWDTGVIALSEWVWFVGHALLEGTQRAQERRQARRLRKKERKL